MALEVEGERVPAPGPAVERLDGDRRVWTDRAVDAAGTPPVRRLVVGDLLRQGPLRSGEPPSRFEPGLIKYAHAHHVALPLRKALRVGGVLEHLLRRSRDLDRGYQRRH